MAIRSGTTRTPTRGRILRSPEDEARVRLEQQQKAKEAGLEEAKGSAGSEKVEAKKQPTVQAENVDKSAAGHQQQREVARDFHAKTQKSVPTSAKNPLHLRMAVLTDAEEEAAKTLEDKTGGKHGGLGDALDGAQGHLDVAALATRAGGGSFGAEGDHMKVNTFATGISGGMTTTHDVDGDGDDEMSASNDASLSRAGPNFGYTHKNSDDGTSTGGGIFVKKGFQAVNGNYGWADKDGDARSVNGMLGGNRKSIVGAAGTSWSPAGSDLTLRGTGIGVATFDRQAKDLGAYAGDDPRLQGKHKVEVEKNHGGALIGSGGMSMVMGLGGRLAVAKGKNVVYRTHMDPQKAHDVVHEGKGTVQFFRDKARSLGLKAENVDIPDISDPDTMKVGDELIVDVTGSVTAGLSLGGFNTAAGVQGTTVGEFELAARKLDDNKVELALTPTRVKGIQVSAHAPFILEVGTSRMKGRAMRQSFVFDLNNPEARAAYAKAIKGEFPNGMPKDAKELPKRGHELSQLIDNEKLPGGVERTYMERLDVQQMRTGGGLNWGVIDAKFGLAGLASHTTRLDETRTVANHQMAVSTRTRGVDRRRQVLLSGTESLGVFGAIRTASVFDEEGRRQTRFGGLKLTAQFTDDTVRGLELNKDMIHKINGAFGTELREFQAKGHKQSREITVERVLGGDDFQTLAELPHAQLQQVANDSGVSVRDLEKLKRACRSLKTDHGRALKVQEWVAEHGLKGMGAVHALLGQDKDALKIDTTSDAYTAPITRVDEFVFEHKEPISADATKGELGKLFKAAKKLFEKIDNGIVDTYDDPILDEGTRLEHREKLVDARRRLNDALSFEHLSPEERTELYARVDRGWTRAVHRDIMDRLTDAGLA